MDLHPTEVDLIQRIRKEYQFGEIIIECRDGLPVRIGKTVVYKKLSTEFNALTDETKEV